MSKSVFAISKNFSQTEKLVDELIQRGLAETQISIIAPDNSGEHSFGAVKETKAPEGAATGATTGGVVGGVLGLLTGIGALAIPGAGPFIAAGPILAALSGLGIGAATGGIVGGLIGLGIPEYEAKVYDDKLKGGNYLISVHAEDGREEDIAKEVFEHHDATDIAVANAPSAKNG